MICPRSYLCYQLINCPLGNSNSRVTSSDTLVPLPHLDVSGMRMCPTIDAQGTCLKGGIGFRLSRVGEIKLRQQALSSRPPAPSCFRQPHSQQGQDSCQQLQLQALPGFMLPHSYTGLLLAGIGSHDYHLDSSMEAQGMECRPLSPGHPPPLGIHGIVNFIHCTWLRWRREASPEKTCGCYPKKVECMLGGPQVTAIR